MWPGGGDRPHCVHSAPSRDNARLDGPRQTPGLIEGRDKHRGDEVWPTPGALVSGCTTVLVAVVSTIVSICDGHVRGQLLPHGEQGPERYRRFGRKSQLLHVGAELLRHPRH